MPGQEAVSEAPRSSRELFQLSGETNVNVPTFFFLRHENVCGSIAAPFPSPQRQELFPRTLMPCLYRPFRGLTWLPCQTGSREVNASGRSIPDQPQIKADSTVPPGKAISQKLACSSIKTHVHLRLDQLVPRRHLYVPGQLCTGSAAAAVHSCPARLKWKPKWADQNSDADL